MVVASLIERKRQGEALTAPEWQELLQAYGAGRVPDYQMAALLMAIRWRGLDDGEAAALTQAMVDSGDTYTWTPPAGLGWDTRLR